MAKEAKIITKALSAIIPTSRTTVISIGFCGGSDGIAAFCLLVERWLQVLINVWTQFISSSSSFAKALSTSSFLKSDSVQPISNSKYNFASQKSLTRSKSDKSAVTRNKGGWLIWALLTYLALRNMVTPTYASQLHSTLIRIYMIGSHRTLHPQCSWQWS